MEVTGLKDGNNTGDLPGIRNSAGDERQIEKTAEDGTNRSSSVFQHTTSDSVNPRGRIIGKLVDERKNIRAGAGKTGKSGTEVVLRDGSIGGVSMYCYIPKPKSVSKENPVFAVGGILFTKCYNIAISTMYHMAFEPIMYTRKPLNFYCYNNM